MQKIKNFIFNRRAKYPLFIDGNDTDNDLTGSSREHFKVLRPTNQLSFDCESEKPSLTLKSRSLKQQHGVWEQLGITVA